MDKTSKALLEAFGERAETLKAISEFSELSAALSEYLYCLETGNTAQADMVSDEVLEEIGDARLTLNTLMEIFGVKSSDKALAESIEKAQAVLRLKGLEEDQRTDSIAGLERRCY